MFLEGKTIGLFSFKNKQALPAWKVKGPLSTHK